MAGVIETRRLRITPVAVEDLDVIAGLLHAPEVRRFLCGDTCVTREAVAGWIADSLAPSSGVRYWRIATLDDAPVGLIGLRPPSTATLALRAIGWRSLELVIALAPGHWARGLATEAVDAIVAEGLSDGVTFAILGAVDAPNERAHRLMARCGFGELGRVDGPAHPLVVYERAL